MTELTTENADPATFYCHGLNQLALVDLAASFTASIGTKFDTMANSPSTDSIVSPVNDEEGEDPRDDIEDGEFTNRWEDAYYRVIYSKDRNEKELALYWIAGMENDHLSDHDVHDLRFRGPNHIRGFIQSNEQLDDRFSYKIRDILWELDTTYDESSTLQDRDKVIRTRDAIITKIIDLASKSYDSWLKERYHKRS